MYCGLLRDLRFGLDLGVAGLIASEGCCLLVFCGVVVYYCRLWFDSCFAFIWCVRLIVVLGIVFIVWVLVLVFIDL